MRKIADGTSIRSSVIAARTAGAHLNPLHHHEYCTRRARERRFRWLLFRSTRIKAIFSRPPQPEASEIRKEMRARTFHALLDLYAHTCIYSQYKRGREFHVIVLQRIEMEYKSFSPSSPPPTPLFGIIPLVYANSIFPFLLSLLLLLLVYIYFFNSTSLVLALI